jgi:hypothetical protein
MWRTKQACKALLGQIFRTKPRYSTLLDQSLEQNWAPPLQLVSLHAWSRRNFLETQKWGSWKIFGVSIAWKVQKKTCPCVCHDDLFLNNFDASKICRPVKSLTQTFVDLIFVDLVLVLLSLTWPNITRVTNQAFGYYLMSAAGSFVHHVDKYSGRWIFGSTNIRVDECSGRQLYGSTSFHCTIISTSEERKIIKINIRARLATIEISTRFH